MPFIKIQNGGNIMTSFNPFWYLDEMGKVDPVKLESMLSFWTGIRVCLGKWLTQAEISLICVIFGNVFRFCFRWTRNKSLRENTAFSLVQKNHSTFDAWRGQIVHKKHWRVKLTFGTRQRDIFHNIHVWCHSKTLSVILNFAFSTSEFNLNWTACIFTFRRTLNTFSYYYFTYRYPTS